ncbi:hypothetical protein RXV86_09435 [Alisedimentitalea sp. MJ-SS2]|uniref:hypothetical protein n=1 Tax=Aliisedimentitalea sp. MJ-SS2 TaxID=3049795 RepID=UPI002913120B|nr:hypothetical protein [Alisedimentitalea sp. MJ-SS2]MDU8927605.1 hypothetical protein [Alisedimentitalea sp. MJ-SS2]
MKLAIAAFGTALVLASGASAMVGPYERAVDAPDAAQHLFTTGSGDYEQANSRSHSPEADWYDGQERKVTQFTTSVEQNQLKGVNAR